MAAYTTTLDFQDGSGDRDVTDLVLVRTLQRRRSLWNDLQPTIDTVSFDLLHDATIWNLLLTEDADVIVTILKDGSPYFKGYVRKNFTMEVESSPKTVRIACEDYGIRLRRKRIDPGTPEQWADYKVSDTTTKASSILHQLLYDAGYEDAEINVTDIDETIDFYVNTREEATYWDRIAQLLFEFGYVFYHDATGDFRIFNFLPASVSASVTFDNSTNANLRGTLSITKTPERYEAVEVEWYEHETLAGVIVFSDTTDGDEDNKCNITLDPSEYYPPNSDSRTVYAEYSIAGRRVINVSSAVLAIAKHADIVQDAFTNRYTKAEIGFHNGGAVARTITQLDITGDATVEGDKNLTRRLNIADTTKVLKVRSDYITAAADAEKLADGVARYYEYQDFEYSFVSEDEAAPGAFATIDESEWLAISNTVVVVEQLHMAQADRYRYRCEGISAYSGRTTETDSEVAGEVDQPGGNYIGTGNIDEDMLAAGAVTVTKVADDALTQAKVDMSDWMTMDGEGLVGYWSLNDVGADTEDYEYEDNSGNGHTAAADDVLTSADGPAGPCPHLSGSANYLRVPDHADFDFGTGDFSWCAWFNLDALSSSEGRDQAIMNRYTEAGVLLIPDTGDNADKVQFQLDNAAGTAQVIASDEEVVAGEWYFVVAMRESGTIQMYVNGVLQTETATADWDIDDSNYLYLGSLDQTNYRLDGKIAHVRVFDLALSQNAVRWLYQNPAGNIPEMMLAHRVVAHSVTAKHMSAENFFFTKAVGSENRATPSSGDVRAYLGKDPAGSQDTTDPVELAIKEYNGEDWEARVRAGMRSGGNVADMLLSGFFQAGESVLSSPGLIWREVTNPFSSEQVSRVAFGNDVLVAVSDAGNIARSTNGGESWSLVTDQFGGTAAQDVEFGNDVFIMVGWSEKVSRSTDDGATWGSLVTMPTSATCIIMTVAYGDGVWMCGGGALTGDAEIARSTNDGVSWSLITNPFAAGNRCFALATDGAGTWIAVSEAGEIAQSTDDGASFSLVTDPFGSTMIRCAAYGDGVFIVAGESGYLARSVDGGATWGSLIDAGFGSSLIIDLAYGEGVWIATGEDGTISRSADGGQSWGASVYSDASVQQPFGADGYFSGVVYDETYRRFVAVGDDSDGSGDPIIAIGEWLEAGSGIVQRGKTANGHYIRFSCGIQACWSFDLVLSGLNASAAYDDWTLPAAMKTTDYMYGCFGANGSHGSRIVPWPASSKTTTACRFRTSADVSTLTLMVFAVGPWK